jgi:hypothetical protein
MILHFNANIGLNGKFLRFPNAKSIIFLKCLQYLINYTISIACIIYVMARQTSKWLQQMTVDIAYAYAISSKTRKLSVQPNT